jgi:hypothetical protein
MKTKIELGKSVNTSQHRSITRPLIRLVYTSVSSSVSNQLMTLIRESVRNPIGNSMEEIDITL